MKTEKANATVNFIIRLWSRKHYHIASKWYNIFSGTVTELTSKKVIYFYTVGQLLETLQKMYDEAEQSK